jgi:isopentenyl phosphate kinase
VVQREKSLYSFSLIPFDTIMSNIIFLKLGGSLITDKTQPQTPRLDVLTRLSSEIAEAMDQNPDIRLVLGHGSGSFGHVPASQYGTRKGVYSAEQWSGFVEVWWAASALNRLVMDALHNAGLPAIAFSPLAMIIARNGQVAAWDTYPLKTALEIGLVPIIHGDVVFDLERGGTILSTEDLFSYLARQLHPNRILIAGRETGVWKDYPTRKQLIPLITPKTLAETMPTLTGSNATDVTGGMIAKVNTMLNLVKEIMGLEVLIFSGEQPGAVCNTLLGASIGTIIRPDV